MCLSSGTNHKGAETYVPEQHHPTPHGGSAVSGKKDLADLRKEYERQGWTVEQTRGNHLKWTPPGGGKSYFSSSTPGDVRAIQNIIKGLARIQRENEANR